MLNSIFIKTSYSLLFYLLLTPFFGFYEYDNVNFRLDAFLYFMRFFGLLLDSKIVKDPQMYQKYSN